MGLFGGTPNRPFGKMPKHANCCVPLCTNNFRNNSGLTFYRIPKEKSIRREYVRLIRNENLILTETQLLPHHSDNIITEILHPYALHRQDHPTDKYSSLAICSQNNINLVQKQYFPSINGLICNALIANINKELKFLLTYRKNNSNTQQYLQNLNNILQTNTVDIILGDFNINYFNELLILPLKQLANSLEYIQIGNKPTFISAGSLLDQVYVKQSRYDEIQNEVVTVYYSDHDCVKIIIKQ